jgi:hypothetical protein
MNNYLGKKSSPLLKDNLVDFSQSKVGDQKSKFKITQFHAEIERTRLSAVP